MALRANDLVAIQVGRYCARIGRCDCAVDHTNAVIALIVSKHHASRWRLDLHVGGTVKIGRHRRLAGDTVELGNCGKII